MKVKYKKAVLWGVIAIVINMVIGNLLYMNPFVHGFFKAHQGHPAMKSHAAFGGVANWIIMNALFSLVFLAILVFLFVLIYKGLPWKGWKKGLAFGLIVAFVKAVPEAFNQYMILTYPTSLILVQLINTIIGITIFGIVLGFFFDRFKAIKD